jgi:hypothetical protein
LVLLLEWPCSVGKARKRAAAWPARGTAKPRERGPSPRQRFVYSAHNWPSTPFAPHHGLSPPRNRGRRPCQASRVRPPPKQDRLTSLFRQRPAHRCFSLSTRPRTCTAPIGTRRCPEISGRSGWLV